jgi:hypothetical protein
MISFVVRAVRALWFVTVVTALLVGLPWLVVHLIGWPLPHTMPSGPTLRDWFDHPLRGLRFWKGLSILFWLVWATAIVYLTIELLGQRGRVRVPRLRVRPLQGLAAGMIGATAATLPATAMASPPAAVAPVALPDFEPGARDAAAPAAELPVYTVQHGDWLSAIAERFLGDRDAFPQIRDLNPQLDARGSGHIEPGWRLRLPADALDRGIRRHASGPFIPAPTDAASPSEAPTTVDPPVVRAEEPAAIEHDVADLDDTDPAAPDVVVGGSRVGAMSGAGLLASLLFALLTAERRRQRTLVPAGHHPPRPASNRAERELRIAQQPADVERLDLALRHLGNALAERAPRPDIVGVRLVGGEVHVLLAHPDGDPPPSWLDEGTQWTLPAHVQPASPGDQPASLPLLATVGSHAGRHLLLDLHRLGTLSLTGHPYRARDLLRHIVCELGCATWTNGVTVLLAGFGDEADALADLVPERIQAIDSISGAAALVDTELRYRSGGDAALKPLVLAVANPDAAGRATLANLGDELTTHGGCGIAIVCALAGAAPLGPAAVIVGDDGSARVEVPGLRLTTEAANVPVDMLEPLAQVFRVARQAGIGPAEPSNDVLAVFDPAALPPAEVVEVREPPTTAVSDDPDATLDEDLAAWTKADPARPRVGILGRIQVDLPGELVDSKHRLYTELLLYFLTRRDRSADRDQIEDALWYGHPAGSGSIRVAVARLRKWLGPRADGAEWISEGAADRRPYRLATGVLVDWDLLRRLADRGRRRGDAGATDYRAALELVRGEPMLGIPSEGRYRRPYTWIDGSDIDAGRIITTITDLAHRLASYSVDVGDTATARWAVQQAWLADPGRGPDDLWIDLMRAEHHDGNNQTLRQIVDELREARGTEVLEDLPPRVYGVVRQLLPDA